LLLHGKTHSGEKSVTPEKSKLPPVFEVELAHTSPTMPREESILDYNGVSRTRENRLFAPVGYLPFKPKFVLLYLHPLLFLLLFLSPFLIFIATFCCLQRFALLL
jgi:hypothetical protein